MRKVLTVLLIAIMMSGSALCFAGDEATNAPIPNFTEHPAPTPIESGEDSRPIVNLNEEPNGKKINNVEQAVIEVTTVKSNTQGQGN